MHRSRVILVIAALVAAVALLLPFVRFTAQGSLNGFDGYGWPATLVLAVPALLALMGDRPESLRPSLAVGAIALTGLAVVLAAFKLADAANAATTEGASLGAGPWVLLGGCLLGMGGALASLSRRI